MKGILNMKKLKWLTILTSLILALGSMGAARAEIIPPYGEGQVGLQAVVLCNELTVRQESSAGSDAVQTLKFGERIIVQPQTSGWARCFLSDSEDEGPAGWVNEGYIAIDPAWYRTEEKTPVYAWNDASAPKVALLDEDVTLPILKVEGDWLIVSLRGAVGCIYAQNGAAEATEPAESTVDGRQDGERFEDTIALEGMEETAQYEHIVNSAMGIEMDYDYEIFERHSDFDRERFVSRYDNSVEPLDYFEVKYCADDADAMSESISEALSAEYDIIQESWTLDRAGNCTRIDVTTLKGQNLMPEITQTVYVIPAGDGCIVATAHMAIESSEGLGARISYIMDTLVITE